MTIANITTQYIIIKIRGRGMSGTIYLAKDNETIQVHTNLLLSEYERFRKLYGDFLTEKEFLITRINWQSRTTLSIVISLEHLLMILLVVFVILLKYQHTFLSMRKLIISL